MYHNTHHRYHFLSSHSLIIILFGHSNKKGVLIELHGNSKNKKEEDVSQ
jgi:hypothetical protein